jgi:Tol biopolymer transport system component
VWIYDIERRSNTRFTFDNSVDIFPAWSRDGSRIYFSSDRKGEFAVYQKPTDGMSNEDSLVKATGSFVLDVHPENGMLLEVRTTGQGLSTILAYDPRTEKEVPLVKGGFRSFNPRFSPDGRWVVYQSDESGRNEIYVIPFMREGSKWQISTGGGIFPLWERSGEIYYVSEGRVMAVKADISNATPEFSIPREILSFAGEADTRIVDVARDGMRFLAYRMGQGERNESLSLISNWPALGRN